MNKYLVNFIDGSSIEFSAGSIKRGPNNSEEIEMYSDEDIFVGSFNFQQVKCILKNGFRGKEIQKPDLDLNETKRLNKILE